MEKLVLDIPDTKSAIVKQVLHSLGIAVPGYDTPVASNYREKLLKVSTWTDDDLKQIETAGKAFNNLKAEEW